MNEWPKGYRHAMSQSDHEEWNASHYPGTLQMCAECGEPTGRCEDDSIWNDDDEPICRGCWLHSGEREAAE